jgi:1-acyl-sn-glycerol-3-phosphate acyltransferase
VTWIRSALFNALFFAWTTVVTLAGAPLLAAPSATMHAYARFWAKSVLVLLRVVCGLDHRVVGPLPPGGVIVASKHQSAWDTIVFMALLPTTTYILKRELLRIPLFGWYLLKAGMIAVDRKGGAGALKSVMQQSEAALDAGRTIVIFPQGTRVAAGASAPYQPGTIGLYTHLKRPVIPAALNSGHFWARRSFIKRPGTITLEFLEPIPPGLPRAVFARQLEERIEKASARLLENPF